jgi:uncharacterized membrane protein
MLSLSKHAAVLRQAQDAKCAVVCRQSLAYNGVDMGAAVNPWLHILAATIWVGPQVFLFAVVVPAVRTVADVKERARLIRLITTRFGYLAWGAMAVLVITGVGNLFENDKSIHYLFHHHFGMIFQVKMTLVVATILLTAAHSFVIGPRMLALQESVTDQSQIASMRRASIIISSINGVLALGILFCAALLNTSFALR